MKFLKFAVSLIGVMAAASTAMAQQSTPDQVSKFLALIVDNGCSITEDEAEVIFPANGFDQPTSRMIAGDLLADGTVEIANGSLAIVDGSCGPEPVLNSNEQQFIDILAFNGCQVSENDAMTLFPQNGMDFDLAILVGESLVDKGVATLSDDRNSIIVGADYCAAAEDIIVNGDVVPVEVEASALDQMNQLLGIMEAQNCRLDVANANEVFLAAGMDPEIGIARAMELVAGGFAEMANGTEFVIFEQTCTPQTAGDVATDQPVDGEMVETPANDMTDAIGSDRDIFVSIFAQNDCTLTEDRARQLFAESGLSMDVVYQIAEEIADEGNGYYTEDDSTLILTLPECAAADAPAEPVGQPVEIVDQPVDSGGTVPIQDADPQALFLAVLAGNNCEITQAGAAVTFATAGLDFNEMMQVASQMLNNGTATSPDGGQTLQVSAPLCMAAGSSTPQTPRDIFISVLRDNDCSMTAGEFGSLLPVEGLDQNTAFGLITDLEAEGVITLPATRDVVTLTAENCR